MRWGELAIPEVALAAITAWCRIMYAQMSPRELAYAMGNGLTDGCGLAEARHYISAYYSAREVRETFRCLRNYGPCPLCGQALRHWRPATLVCQECEGDIHLLGYYASQLTKFAKGGGDTK